MSHSGERTIYFIVPIDGPGRIKIGFSRSPERRIYELSALSPYQLRIAAHEFAANYRSSIEATHGLCVRSEHGTRIISTTV